MSAPPPHSGGALPEQRWEPEAILWIGWRHRGWVVLGLVLGIAVGAALGLGLPRVYQSSAQISIVKKRPDAVTGWDTRQLSTEMQISPPADLLKSSLIIDHAIRTNKLASLPIFAHETKELTEVIRDALIVVPGRTTTGQSFVFRLHYRGANAEDSQEILTAVLDSYREYMDKKHQSVSQDTVELILRDKVQLEKDLAEKEAAYREFRERAPLMGKTKDGLEIRQDRLNSIQVRRAALLLQRVELEGQLAVLDDAIKEKRDPQSIMILLADFARKSDAGDAMRDKTQSVQDQLVPLLVEERKLLELYGTKHPEVVAVRQRIEAARRMLVLPPSAWKGKADDPSEQAKDDPISMNIQLLRERLNHVKASEGVLEQVFKSEQDEARRLATFEIQNEALRTRLTVHQQLYEALVKRLNEVSLTRNVGGYQIEMIEPPSLGKKVAPSLSLMLLIGAFAGLLGGLVLAYWAERRGETVVAVAPQPSGPTPALTPAT